MMGDASSCCKIPLVQHVCQFLVRVGDSPLRDRAKPPTIRHGEVAGPRDGKPPVLTSVVIQMAKILIVDDEPADRHLMQQALQKDGYELLPAEDAAQALEIARRESPDAVLLDVLLPDANGLETFQQLRALDPALPVIFVTASGSSNLVIQAMQLGALDYLVKPLRVSEVRSAVQHALDVRNMASVHAISESAPAAGDGDVIIGRSAAMQKVYKDIGLVASQDVIVLIRGESGTGKELVARAIYHFSRRADGPFLAVNCAAIPETLLESELFGHEKGAFTGADRRRIGKFELCDGGTLFLDEIGDMPLLLQSKLLRILQDQTFERVGGNQTIKTNVRIIAATNQDLEELVQEKRFREDLYYRLNGYTIFLPLLRDRDDDIDLLADFFRRQANRDLKKDVQGFSQETLAVFRQYRWPGNVRELQNVVRQAVLKATGPVIIPEFLPETLLRSVERPATGAPLTLPDDSRTPFDLDRFIDDRLATDSNHVYDDVVHRVEERLVRRTLDYCQGNKERALERLGINPSLFRSPAVLELLDLDHVAGGVDSLMQPGMTMEAIEREAIRRALLQAEGKRIEAAKSLGISVRTLQRKIKEFGLEDSER